VLNLTPCLEGLWLDGVNLFLILDIYKDESLASDFASFVPKKGPRYSFSRRLNGPQSGCGSLGEEKYFCTV
jgi:hypothetical protein